MFLRAIREFGDDVRSFIVRYFRTDVVSEKAISAWMQNKDNFGTDTVRFLWYRIEMTVCGNNRVSVTFALNSFCQTYLFSQLICQQIKIKAIITVAALTV